jgi:hypothetical protein
MSGNIDTREFSINDYDAAIKLWQRVEGLEIAEGDDRESVAQFLARNPALSRVATDGSGTVGVALCGHDDAGDLCPAAALPEFTAARIIVGHHDNDALDPDPAQTLQAFIHQTLTESASLISRINRQMINVSAASRCCFCNKTVTKCRFPFPNG